MKFPLMFRYSFKVMKIKRFILPAVLLMGSMFASAQGQSGKEESNGTFNPHWFMQVQGGIAHTVGEASFGDLLSPAAALNVGYKFTPVLGVRVGMSGWQAKGCWAVDEQTYKYKYLQGNADLMVDLSTLFCKYNARRVFNAYAFGGVALNHAFDNDEANSLPTGDYTLEYLWQDSKNFVAGRFGVGCDLRLNDRLSFNIEGNANVLSDKFNSKKAGNCDWQLNALVGLSIKLGKSGKKTAPVYQEVPAATPRQEEPRQEPVKEEVAPVTKTEPAVVAPVAIRKNIFFALNSARIQDDQQGKLAELADYLTQHPEVKVSLTGYADKQTGNARINSRLSQQRADNVAAALQARGIAKERIETAYKGDTEQPFFKQEENRVVICVTE